MTKNHPIFVQRVTEYYKRHKEDYGRKYVRGGIMFFTLRQALHITLVCKSIHRHAFIDDTLDILMSRTSANLVSHDEHVQTLQQLFAAEQRADIAEQKVATLEQRMEKTEQELHEFKAEVREANPFMKSAASAAGKALAAQKGTKVLRNMN